MSSTPRFDRPITTQPATEVFGALDFKFPEQRPLPTLTAPERQPTVIAPRDEALVPVAHRRIRALGNYWHAGWSRALPVTMMRAGAFERLCAVAEDLPDRFGLAIFDAWRPLDLQAELYEAAYGHPGLPPGFVAQPVSDPTTPPPHLTGGTVDLTLTFDGIPLAPASGFDDFTDGAHTEALEGQPGVDRDVRRMLYWAMHDKGFVVLQQEWWHFEFGTRRWAAINGTDPLYGPGQLA